MNYIDFVILNSNVTVLYLRFIKRTIFCGKTEKFKIVVFFPAIYPWISGVPFFKSKKTVSKKNWLVRKCYISKSV